MRFEQLNARLRTLPQVADWPQMLQLIERAVPGEQQSVWDYPVIACEAVGGTAEAAMAGAAAVFCSLTSIHLVDDMLDDDPQGDFRRWGAGVTANLALAFQAAAHCQLDEPGASPAIRAELHSCLGRMALATAFGQHLDSREAAGEADYWRIVGAKTPPLFGAALRLGALLGGAPPPIAADLERLGAVLGKFVQVSDDVADALRSPASADWQRRPNNLAILYAMTADHPGRAEFLTLSARCEDPASLAAAQQLLLRSGSVSYCALKMIELSRQAHAIFAGTALRHPAPVAALLAATLRPLERLLSLAGLDEPLLAAPPLPPPQARQPLQASQSSQPSQPSQSSQPSQPLQSSQPSQPSQPLQSSQPSQPSQPSQSSQPSQPTTA
ncbi:MAG TPA: polyprenyl synthetase family protein [Thermoanaerobaculia bacterium]|nr:polyprenyl synthetase family protein [Thermoanaerobaculia bacterium]